MFGQSRREILQRVAEWAADPQMPESVLQAVTAELKPFQGGVIDQRTVKGCREVLKVLRLSSEDQRWTNTEAVFAVRLLDFVNSAHKERLEKPGFELEEALKQPARIFYDTPYFTQSYSVRSPEDYMRARYDTIGCMVAESGIGAVISMLDATVSSEPDLKKLTPKKAFDVLQTLQSGILGREVIR